VEFAPPFYYAKWIFCNSAKRRHCFRTRYMQLLQCYGRVIAEGEKYLLHSIDPFFRKMTHEILVHAYSDVVASRSRYYSESEDESGIKLSAELARDKALEHFHQALKIDRNSIYPPTWYLTWRLVACIPPAYFTYVCIDE
jgi:hypothetical protein